MGSRNDWHAGWRRRNRGVGDTRPGRGEMGRACKPMLIREAWRELHGRYRVTGLSNYQSSTGEIS